MGFTEFTAGAALLVSVGNLSWNIYSAWRKRHSLVRVELSVPYPDSKSEAKPIVRVALTVVNLSDHPVRIASVWLESELKSFGGLVYQVPVAQELPIEVSPHDSVQLESSDELMAAHGVRLPDLTDPLSGWARLSTGETFASKPRKYRSTPEEWKKLMRKYRRTTGSY